MTKKNYSTVDEYHSDFPDAVKERLDLMRSIIRSELPEAEEVISYNMPTFRIQKAIVHYAAYKKHLSLFPAPAGAEWDKKFEGYPTSGKGTIQFSFVNPLPELLIREIVRYQKARQR